jgi:hypothetical protein
MSYVIIKNKKWNQIIILSTYFFFIVTQYFWIKYRINEYNSPIFMSSPKPFESIEQFNQIIKIFREYLIDHYMPLPFTILWLSGIIVTMFIKQRFGSKSFYDNIDYYKIFVSLNLILVLLFFLLFGRQFDVHDYYFISIFSPLIFVTWSSTLIFLHKEYKLGAQKNLVYGLLTFLLLTYATVEHKFFHYIRDYKPSIHFRQWSDRANKYYGLKLIEYLRINEKDLIFVVNDGTPNLSLSRFNKIGYSMSYPKNEDYVRVLSEDMKVRKTNIAFINKNEFEQFRISFDSFFIKLINNNEITVLQLKSLKAPPQGQNR